MRKPHASPFHRRARGRATRAKMRSRAPRHPVGPEAQLRAVTAKLFEIWHRHLKEHTLRIAPHARRLRRDATTASDAPIPSAFASTWEYALHLLHTSPFKRIVEATAAKVARSAREQTAAALGLGDDYKPDLTDDESNLASDVYDGAESKMRDSITRAADVLDDWIAGEDPELEGLGSDLDAGLSGITGSAVGLVGLAFGAAFGAMIKSAQEDAGIGHYAWMANRDSVVRPEHLALDDGSIYLWDEPPLTADKSSNEEDDHPGEDYNCRCVASPVPPDEAPIQGALDE